MQIFMLCCNFYFQEIYIYFLFSIEDDLSITTLTSSQIQTTSPQPASAATYALNPQNSNFVATHMLGQNYGAENNFGAIYHHNAHHAYHTSPYHKVATAPPTAANVYGSHYQGFYGQMTRVDYIPR